MLQRLKRPAWTCQACIQRAAGLARGLTTSAPAKGGAAAAIPQSTHQQYLATKTSPGVSQDDATLRRIFDNQEFWQEFSARSRLQNGSKSVGLFQNRYLTRPEGFQDFADVTLRKCKRIVAKVLAYQSVEELKKVVRDLDRLSDLLCRVIDLSDFVRSVHPDPRVQSAATQAYSLMFEYMNVLNTTTGLNDRLKQAHATPEVYASWSQEERTVAEILMKDFSKSAIDLPASDRQAFVDISNDIADVGSAFVDNLGPERPYLSFPSSKLKGMDPMIVRQLTKWGTVTLPTIGMPATHAMRSVEDPEIRREIYMANRSASKENLQRLEHLLVRRAELAKLSGYDSFSQLALSDKMAKTPEAVSSFLDALQQANYPRVEDEAAELLALKAADARAHPLATTLNAWDREYYTARVMAALRSKARSIDTMSSYFSLGTVIQGLSRIYHRLYGIRLVPRETPPGETWNDDVRRLDVIDDTEGHIAVIYCDLFERAGKSPHPAHFTLRCSRRIGEEELKEAAQLHSQLDTPFATVQEAVNDGLATALNARDGNALYQLPTIALICDFAVSPRSQSGKTRPSLLMYKEVKTLFHEMGHALHSICGRTALHNVAGTRCPTDFAELPSVLNENFAGAPEALALFARHWETDDPLNVDRVRDREDFDRRLHGTEIEAQILLGVLDQRYHSREPLDWRAVSDGKSSTQIYHDVWNQYSSIPDPAGTSWQGFFGHLYGYGATYYSYLFDRAIAGKIWRDVFQRVPGGALDPAAGHLYREQVLRHGGARDGWHSVAGVLGDEYSMLAEGSAAAMEEVGRWGV